MRSRTQRSIWRHYLLAPRIRPIELSVARLQIDLYLVLNQPSRAVAVGLDYLGYLGISWSPHPTDEEARRAYERIWSELDRRTTEELIALPLMTDPACLATLDVLNRLCSPAQYTDLNLVHARHLSNAHSHLGPWQQRRVGRGLCPARNDRRPSVRRVRARVPRRATRLMNSSSGVDCGVSRPACI